MNDESQVNGERASGRPCDEHDQISLRPEVHGRAAIPFAQIKASIVSTCRTRSRLWSLAVSPSRLRARSREPHARALWS